MSFALIVLVAFLAAANAGLLGAPLAQVSYAAPIAKAVVAEPYDPNPQYSFGYEVQDPSTGDSHGHSETRNGDVVQGAYALLDSDGTRRLVEYTADPINGFNAVVHKQPLGGKAIVAAPAIAKVAAPLAYAAPVSYASPIGYAAPVAKLAAHLPYASPYAHAPAPVAYYH